MTLCEQTGKVRYATRVAARRATSNIKGAVRLYRCVFCGSIHVTSKGGVTRSPVGRRRVKP